MDNKCVRTLSFKVTAEEESSIRRAAREKGIPVSRYLRLLLLESPRMGYSPGKNLISKESLDSLKTIQNQAKIIEEILIDQGGIGYV